MVLTDAVALGDLLRGGPGVVVGAAGVPRAIAAHRVVGGAGGELHCCQDGCDNEDGFGHRVLPWAEIDLGLVCNRPTGGEQEK